MRTILLVGLFTALTCPAFADELAAYRRDNWHQWRGPMANGFAPEPRSADDLGSGLEHQVESGRARPGRVDADRLGQPHLPHHRDQDRSRRGTAARRGARSPRRQPLRHRAADALLQFVVLCYDRASGKLLWQQVATEAVPHEGHHKDHGYASPSPVTDGQFVYASFGSRGIYCFDMDGKLQWDRDLGDCACIASSAKPRRRCWRRHAAGQLGSRGRLVSLFARCEHWRNRAGRRRASPAHRGRRRWWSTTPDASRSSSTRTRRPAATTLPRAKCFGSAAGKRGPSFPAPSRTTARCS